MILMYAINVWLLWIINKHGGLVTSLQKCTASTVCRNVLRKQVGMANRPDLTSNISCYGEIPEVKNKVS